MCFCRFSGSLAARLAMDRRQPCDRWGASGLCSQPGRGLPREGLERDSHHRSPRHGFRSVRDALRRARGRARLSQPVHPPCGHLEPSPDQRRCRHRGVPLEGLSHQDRRPAKGHASRDRRVHPPLPDPRPGFHRIRHYGLLAGASRKATIARIRDLLREAPPDQDPQETAEIVPLTLREPCPCCGGPMRIVEIFRRGQKPMLRAPPQERAA